MNNTIRVITQAFYGNKMETDIKKENIDRFILGYIDNSITINKKVDRTIVKIPNTDNIVIIYNKYQEEEELNRKNELLSNNNYVLNPLVIIPEHNIKIYSRCIACRINENGELESIQNEDYEKLVKYLSE